MEETAKKLRVGVIVGGVSGECHISLRTGATVYDFLDRRFFDPVIILLDRGMRWWTLPPKFVHRSHIMDYDAQVRTEGTPTDLRQLASRIDFAFNCLHGKMGEDGTVQALFEWYGIPYQGSGVRASIFGMNKAALAQILPDLGVETVDQRFVSRAEWRDNRAGVLEKLADFGLPCVVKPCSAGSSLGVGVVRARGDWEAALDLAFEHDTLTMVEEYIAGMEFSTIVLDTFDGEPEYLAVTEFEKEPGSDIFDYEQKYMDNRGGSVYTPARLDPDEISRIGRFCVDTYKKLNFSVFARIDGFYTPERIVINDPNTLPGLDISSFVLNQVAEAGIHPTDFITRVIGLSVKKGRPDLLRRIEALRVGRSVNVKTRVAVIFGGPGNERDTSVRSGANVFTKLYSEKYDPLAVFMDRDKRLYRVPLKFVFYKKAGDFENHRDRFIPIELADLRELCDFVFIAVHGAPGEDGTLQTELDLLGLPYNGPGAAASRLCMNKHATVRRLAELGFDVPESLLLTSRDELDKIPSGGYPRVVKPNDDGCSFGVSMVKSRAACVERAGELFDRGYAGVLVEEALRGIEITCGVLGNADKIWLPPSETLKRDEILKYEEKFLQGGGVNITPPRLPADVVERIGREVVRIADALELDGYSRIDAFWRPDVGRLTVFEVNTIPGITVASCLFHQAAEAGIMPYEFIDRVIELGFVKRGARR